MRRARPVAQALVAVALVAVVPSATRADPDELADDLILDRQVPFEIESVQVSTMIVEQSGRGYQSVAGPAQGPGSENLLVIDPELEVVARQGPGITHRLAVPIDVVSSASADAIDVTTSASRVTEAGSVDLTTTFHVDDDTDLFLQPGFHLEEQMRSYNLGLGVAHSFAEDNAVLALNVQAVVDWLDWFELDGGRQARGARSSMNGNVGFTQILSPTTVAHVDYGVTLQTGELGNAWNSVPLAGGGRGKERLPDSRQRHALVGRLVQWLPWSGSLAAYYRLYDDDWGITAHTVEGQLSQRLFGWLLLRASYRVHVQQAARFYTESGQDVPDRTADSDLARFAAQTLGGRVTVDLPRSRNVSQMRAAFAYERYFRTNDLRANIVMCTFGLLF